MTPTNNADAYPSQMISMHWLMLVLIAAGYALMELKSFAARGSELRSNMAVSHYLIGLSVFLLACVRLMLRIAGRVPPIEPPPAAWEMTFAKVVHWFLYAFMIVLPLLGWFALSAKGRPVHLFVFDLPFPIAQDDALARKLKKLHEWLANAGYFALGLHAAAALFHHFVKHDSTLRRMLPGKWRKR